MFKVNNKDANGVSNVSTVKFENAIAGWVTLKRSVVYLIFSTK